jgi:hypothetical protein
VKGQDKVLTATVISVLSCGALGGVLGASLADPASGGWDIDAGYGAIKGIGIGALAGLAIGAGIGYAVSSEEMDLNPEDRDFKGKLRSAARYPLGGDSFAIPRQ